MVIGKVEQGILERNPSKAKEIQAVSITLRQATDRPGKPYVKQMTVDVTRDQLSFISGVQQVTGETASQVMRTALELWRTAAERGRVA